MKVSEFLDHLDQSCINNNIRTPWISRDVLDSMKDYSKRFSDQDLQFIAAECGELDLGWKQQVTHKHIESIITKHNIREKTNPYKSTSNSEKSQRIMDSLSRLLSVDERISPCVAVMLFNQQIVIASNAPNDATTTEQLRSYLEKKAAIIQKFLEELYEHQKDNPIIEIASFVAIYNIVQKLIECGGSDNNLITIPNDGRPRETLVKEHLIQDLLKISKHYLKGRNAEKNDKTSKCGFNSNQIEALHNKNVVVLVALKHGYHAEQGILKYYDSIIDKDLSVEARQEKYGIVPIGITKLCCYDCNSVLEKRKEVSYRGTHGISYPGTRVGSMTSGSYSQRQTQLSNEKFILTPDDSASDVEIKGVKMISVSDAVRSSNEQFRRHNFFSLLQQQINSPSETTVNTPVLASQ